VPITRIGGLKHRRSGRPTMTMLTPDGSRVEVKPGGWEHFSGIAKGRKNRR
jgi:thiamine-monophosphate kinase